MKNNVYGVMVSVGVIGIEDGVKIIPVDEDEMKRKGIGIGDVISQLDGWVLGPGEVSYSVAVEARDEREAKRKGLVAISDWADNQIGRLEKIRSYATRLSVKMFLEEKKPKFKVGDIVRLKSGGALYEFGNIPLRDMKVESVWEASKGDGSTGWRYHVTIMKIDGMSDEIGGYAESRCFNLCEELLERSEEMMDG